MESVQIIADTRQPADLSPGSARIMPFLCLLLLLACFVFDSGSSVSVINLHRTHAEPLAATDCAGNEWQASPDAYAFRVSVQLGAQTRLCYYREANWPEPVALIARNVSARRTADTFRTPHVMAAVD